MADSDKTLKLLIELGVIGKDDARAANDLLAETRQTADKTSGAVTDLAASENVAAGSAEKLHMNHRAMHQIMHMIGQETAPELGHALTGALYGPIGAALAVGAIFEGIREKIKATNAELDKMAESAADPTFLEGIKAKQKVMEDATETAADYADKINQILEGEKGITAELTAQLGLDAAINAARGEQTKASHSLAEAEIKEQEARGDITPQVAAARMAALKIKEIQDEAEAKRSEQAKIATDKAKALQEAQDKQPESKANAAALTETYEKDKARRAQDTADFGNTEKNDKGRKFAQDKIDAALEMQKKIAEYKARGIQINPENERDIEQELARDQAYQKNITAGENRLKRNKATEGDFNDLGRKAETARKKETENTDLISKLTDELKRLTDEISATKGIQDSTTKTKTDTVLAEFAAKVYGEVAKFKQEDQKIFSTPGDHTADAAKLNKSEAGVYRAMAQAATDAATAHSDTLGTILGALEDLRRANVHLQQQIQNGRGYNNNG